MAGAPPAHPMDTSLPGAPPGQCPLGISSSTEPLVTTGPAADLFHPELITDPIIRGNPPHLNVHNTPLTLRDKENPHPPDGTHPEDSLSSEPHLQGIPTGDRSPGNLRTSTSFQTSTIHQGTPPPFPSTWGPSRGLPGSFPPSTHAQLHLHSPHGGRLHLCSLQGGWVVRSKFTTH